MKRILSCILLAGSLLSASLAHTQWQYIELNPPGSIWSEVWGVSETDQVGASAQGYLCCFPARWQGTAGSVEYHNNAHVFYATDGVWRAGVAYQSGNSLAVAASGVSKNASPLYLVPKATSSVARALWKGTFGGETVIDGAPKATLWPSIKEGVKAIVLHPPKSGASAVYAMFSNMQAGVVDGRAATWQGTAKSFVDRHPSGYWQSGIYGLHQSIAVGSVIYISGGPMLYAAVWNLVYGTFSTVHPYPYVASRLTGVSWDSASGWVEDSAGMRRAGVWDVATGRFTDLHRYLPGHYTESEATSIWRAIGDVTYVGGIVQGPSGPQAMLWYLPPPQP